MAGEFVYDHPFQWGPSVPVPTCKRVGNKYSDDWHRAHLHNPRDVVPGVQHACLPWLETAKVDAAGLALV